MSVKVEITHLPGVQAALAAAKGKIPLALIKASTQARRLLVAELKQYPPAPTGSRYRRTGRLGRGWERAKGINGGMGFQLINPIEYAGLVQGDDQAWMHAGRWTPASQIARNHEEDVLQLYEDGVKEAIE